LSNLQWIATDWGAEYGETIIPPERCAKMRKGRYVALREQASLFRGSAYEISFIKAWHYVMRMSGYEIDQTAFRVTIREIAKVHQHYLMYHAAEIALGLNAELRSPARYFDRRQDRNDLEIDLEASAIFRAVSHPRAEAGAL
jgi:hypothetical protein